MSEQLVRCRPTLERIIKGEYPPAVKAHREATSEGGLRLNMARDAVGYGMLSEKEVEESVLPELQRWALRSIGPEEAKMAGEDGMESMVSRERSETPPSCTHSLLPVSLRPDLLDRSETKLTSGYPSPPGRSTSRGSSSSKPSSSSSSSSTDFETRLHLKYLWTLRLRNQRLISRLLSRLRPRHR